MNFWVNTITLKNCIHKCITLFNVDIKNLKHKLLNGVRLTP